MNKNKLVLLLQTFSEKEWAELKDFIRSPFFNNEKQLVELLDAFSTFIPSRLSELPEKDQFFKRRWPSETWDSKKIDYQMSKLNKLAERFLAIQSFEEQDQLVDLELLDVLSRKGLRKAYRQIDRKLDKQLAEQEQYDKGGLFFSLRHAQIKELDFGRTRKRESDFTIELNAQTLDRYYYVNRLALACNMLDRQAILNTKYDTQLSEHWLEHVKAQQFFGEPLIEIYYTIYQALLQESEEKYFFQVKELLNRFENHINRQTLAEIYLLSINYCARKIRQGHTDFIKEAFTIYTTGIHNKALYQEGHLSPWTFTNVVKLSLRLQDYEWTETFIEAYQDQLPPTFQESAMQYNLADLYYYTARFDEAQEALRKVEYTDPNFYLGARELLAKIYYETGAEESLLSMIASFTMFLKRNKKLSNHLKQPYLNFCRLLLKIVRRSKRDVASLEEELTETPLLASRNWLQKIEAEHRK